MKRVLLGIAVALLTLLLTAPAASAFGWKDVLRMHEAGIADSLILQKIDYSGTTFRLGADEITALKEAGVSDTVISAMLRTEAEEEGGYDDGNRYGGGYYEHPYFYYPHGRVYVGLGLGVYGPYPWECDAYWYPRYGRYGRVTYGYPSYRYYPRHRSYYGHYGYDGYGGRHGRYGRYDRPGPEPIRYRTRVESRIDTHNRGVTGYRSRPGTGTPHTGTPRVRAPRSGGSGPSPTRIRGR